MKTLFAVSIVALTVALAGCGGGSGQTLPPATSSSARISTSPTAPSSSAPAWQSKYTPAQLKTYNAALKRWKDYTAKANAIYAEGVDTPGAEAVFKEYTAISPSLISQLKTDFQGAGLRITTPEKPLWWRPIKINGTTDVKFEQCSDVTVVRALVNGKVEHSTHKSPRVLAHVEMEKPKGYDWLVYSVKEGTTPCAPTG